MATPEELARGKIDQLLLAAGWAVQKRSEINLSASRGVAVRPSYRPSWNSALAAVRRSVSPDSVWKQKQAVIDELAAKGVFLDEIASQVGSDFDPFDLVCHIAFDQPPLTRRERVERVRKRHVFAKHGVKVRAVLEALLQKYADTGLRSVESMEILKVEPLSTFGTPVEIVKLFGGKPAYLAAIHELETELYAPSAA